LGRRLFDFSSQIYDESYFPAEVKQEGVRWVARKGLGKDLLDTRYHEI
jgi:hypothetical protein